MYGPWQPSEGRHAPSFSTSDHAARSLSAHLAAGGAATDEGNSAAAAEVDAGCFAPFVATHASQYTRLVELGAILDSDVVCDLGFGDGALICGIVELTGCTGCGCELDPTLVADARARVDECGMGKAIALTESPIARYLMSPAFLRATVIVVFLVPQQLQAILPFFEKAMSLGARIVSQRYKIPGLTPKRSIDVGSAVAIAACEDAYSFPEDSQETANWKAPSAKPSDEPGRGVDRGREDYFPDQGAAFLYHSHRP
jgi:hypothetical protein